MFRSLIKTAAALAVLVSAQVAVAHDIVLVPGTKALTVRFGHPGDWQPIEPRRLIEVQAYAGDGPAVEQQAALKKRGLDFVLQPFSAGSGRQPVLLAARYDNGLWARPAKVGDAKPQARNTTRLMMPEADRVTANPKFAKGLVARAGDEAVYKRRVGHLLELVPQRNPADLKAGEALPVLVLLDGKPLEGAGIEVSNMVDKLPEDKIRRYTTDANGIAQVMLRERGINMLGVDVEQPNDGRFGKAVQGIGADVLVMVATYTFVR